MKFKSGSLDLDRLFKETSHLQSFERLLKVSENFLNIPYRKGTLIGSSIEEEIFTVNFEEVDCMTFIEYVEALRLSNNREDFIEKLKLVRYYDGLVDFKWRRHFFSDWDSLESVKNVTEEIGNSKIKIIKKELNRRENGYWIEGLGVKERLISFIPLDSIDQISSKLDSTYYIGFFTSKEGLDVTHVGIIFRDAETLKLRHASSIHGKVVDEPYLDYARDKEGFILYKPLF